MKVERNIYYKSKKESTLEKKGIYIIKVKGTYIITVKRNIHYKSKKEYTLECIENLKILRWEPRKIFKVCLAILQYYARKG